MVQSPGSQRQAVMFDYDYVILSGGFDPLHTGHLAMIRDASLRSKHGVIILLNSDEWLTRKKGKPFMNAIERADILLQIRGVERVYDFNDDDGTATDGIRFVAEVFSDFKLAFGNGGDRKDGSTPSAEHQVCKEHGIDMLWGLGGDYKKNSSSAILANWTRETEQRPWGSFTTYEVGKGYKVKTLSVNPGQRLSLQYHNHRAEYWTVLSGTGLLETTRKECFKDIKVGDQIYIPRLQCHRVSCTGTEPLVIMEAQIGDYVGEDDIVRIQDDYAR